MIARGIDGTFYEIPDDKTEEYKIPPEEVRAQMGRGMAALPNAPMGWQGACGRSPGGAARVAI